MTNADTEVVLDFNEVLEMTLGLKKGPAVEAGCYRIAVQWSSRVDIDMER